MRLFDKIEGFPWKWVAGFGIAIIAFLALVIFIRENPVIRYVKVPEVKVIEKKVIVKKPVYLSRHDRQQIQCMAENTYFEAGHEPIAGRIAVNNVVLNRVRDNRFPKTPCGVINQRSRGVCQFSWKCEGHKRIGDRAAFAAAKQIAEHVYLGNYGDVTGGSKFYHAYYVNPHWRLARVTRIGAHIFYRG